jgi:hypothetical protein
MRTLHIRLMLLTCGMVPVATALADTIPVDNPSFEILPTGGLPLGCGVGCSYSVGPVPGWTSSGDVGQFQPGVQAGNFTYFDSLSDGITSAYLNAGGSMFQQISNTVQPGVTYTLNVDLGWNNATAFAGVADLSIGGNRYLATGVMPTQGNWSTFTATYTGLPADAGDPIIIDLSFNGSPNGQANFDNVRLTTATSAVPEPTFTGMLALCFAGLIVSAHWKRIRKSGY